jgi:hypothetical protein
VATWALPLLPETAMAATPRIGKPRLTKVLQMPTAVIAEVATAGATPCELSIPILDGKAQGSARGDAVADREGRLVDLLRGPVAQSGGGGLEGESVDPQVGQHHGDHQCHGRCAHALQSSQACE